MIPLKPKSVKVTPELDMRIRKIAQSIDYSDSQLIAIGMKAILDLIEAPGPLVIPRIVVMARAALNYDKSPPEFMNQHEAHRRKTASIKSKTSTSTGNSSHRKRNAFFNYTIQPKSNSGRNRL